MAGSAAAEAAPDARPNILLLISDDQAWSVFNRDLMPTVYGQLVDKGVLMRRAYVNTSLCCPSRAQILTSLFEHHTGVDANEIPLLRPTLPQALHDRGYRTMLAGKYLNSWPCVPRPEFDRWVCTSTPAPSNTALTHPYVNVDGVWNQYGGYQPDVLATFATDFITQTPKDQPFFVMYSPTSPHLPADDPRYDDMPVSPPRGGSFNANTMTEGAPRFARRSALSADEIANSDANYVSMAHATRSLDDAIGAVLDSLGDRSRDTLVIFMSDNGFLYGEHRRVGKNDQWEESVNVPMAVRYPAVLSADQSFVSDDLVQNVDIGATIADVVGFPWKADGRSFMPILEHRKGLRTAALIEHCSGPSRGTLDCSGVKFDGGRVETPGFHGIVTQRYKYVEFDDGSIQLLDLKKDPHEMHNLARDRAYAHLKQQLAHRMRAIMSPRLDTTIATGPVPRCTHASRGSRTSRSRGSPPIDAVSTPPARPVRGTRVRAGSMRTATSRTATTSSRSWASARAGVRIGRRRRAPSTSSLPPAPTSSCSRTPPPPRRARAPRSRTRRRFPTRRSNAACPRGPPTPSGRRARRAASRSPVSRKGRIGSRCARMTPPPVRRAIRVLAGSSGSTPPGRPSRSRAPR